LDQCKKEHDICLRQNDQKIELLPNSDVWIRRSNLKHILFTSKTAPIMARNLFKELFTIEELATHSLNGRKCNADKTDGQILPALDCVRKNNIIGKLFADSQTHKLIPKIIKKISFKSTDFVLKQNGHDIDAITDKKDLKLRKVACKEINKSLADLMRAIRTESYTPKNNLDDSMTTSSDDE
jgi:hypothetical protein